MAEYRSRLPVFALGLQHGPGSSESSSHGFQRRVLHQKSALVGAEMGDRDHLDRADLDQIYMKSLNPISECNLMSSSFEFNLTDPAISCSRLFLNYLIPQFQHTAYGLVAIRKVLASHIEHSPFQLCHRRRCRRSVGVEVEHRSQRMLQAYARMGEAARGDAAGHEAKRNFEPEQGRAGRERLRARGQIRVGMGEEQGGRVWGRREEQQTDGVGRAQRHRALAESGQDARLRRWLGWRLGWRLERRMRYRL